MYNLAVSYVKSYVVNPASIGIKHQIPWLHLLCADLGALSRLGA